MGRKVKWGVLGTADIARRCTIPAMQKSENCYLYGIAGRSREKTEQFQQQFGFEKAFDSLEAILEDDTVEAVYIPLPNTMHKEWVIKAAEHGKHVLCEKPLAGSEADVKEMIEVCDKNGVLFMEAFAYLHSPLIRSVKDTIRSGEIASLFMEQKVRSKRQSHLMKKEHWHIM